MKKQFLQSYYKVNKNKILGRTKAILGKKSALLNILTK